MAPARHTRVRAAPRRLRDVAVRGGMAVGGDRDVVYPASRSPRPRAAHAVADAGASRSARGAGYDRALPELSQRDPSRIARARRSELPRSGAGGAGPGARALRGRVCGRRGPARWACGWAQCPARRARDMDLVGDARDPAAARERQRHRPAGPDRHRLASPPRRRVGRWLLAAGVRVRAVARLTARGGRRPRDVRRADRALRPRRRAPSTAARNQRGAGAVADRPADDRAHVGRARISRRRGLPRLSPADDVRPPGVGQRRAALRRRAGRARSSRSMPASSSRECSRGSPAAGSACARSTPSCSAIGGTRACSGSGP